MALTLIPAPAIAITRHYNFDVHDQAYLEYSSHYEKITIHLSSHVCFVFYYFTVCS